MTEKAPVVLKSMEEVAIRKNAADVDVYLYMLKEKPKKIAVKKGSVLAMALDKAGIDVEDPSKLDLRVNSKKASLLQVLEQGDTLYIANKVAGNGNRGARS